MAGIAFVPPAVTVRVGQTIKWVNQDTVVHNVTAENGASFHSSDFTKGGSYSYTPTKAGTISYVCTIHPNMTAKITVTS
jgi:plastocyanin